VVEPDEAMLRWAVDAAKPGASVREVRGLRHGGSPWLVSLTAPQPVDVVLRLGTESNLAGFATEVAALQLASSHACRLLDCSPRTSPVTFVRVC
jgi:hypothetical protein